MDNSLVMYPNLQFNPIEIPDYTIVEIYKDTIATENGLGYSIIPIEGLTQKEILTKVDERVQGTQPDGYSQYDVLYGAATASFNHKIIYAVWYTGEKPSYPARPEIVEQTPAQPLNVWQEFEYDNDAASSYITVTLTLTAFDNIEFYINNDYFALDIEKPKEYVKEVTINREGVFYDGKPIDTFKMSSAPKLKAGINTIKVKSIGVQYFNIEHRQKF